MSFVALLTDRYDAMVRFYGERLGLPTTERWDRSCARGCRFDLGDGLRLELLDNRREASPRELGEPGDRVQLVIEVADLDAAARSLDPPVPEPTPTSWGARIFQVRDPDGVAVTLLQWTEPRTSRELAPP